MDLETIEAILAVIGLVSLGITVLRVLWTFFSSGIEWLDNVTITEESYQADNDYEEPGTGIYPTVFKDDNIKRSEFLTATIISPQRTIIRNLKIKKLDIRSIEKNKCKYKTVKTVKQVTPQFPLCMIVERGEAIAPYIIEWRIDYGGKATYCFYENMRDSNNDRKGIEYKYGVIAKVRKLLDLK